MSVMTNEVLKLNVKKNLKIKSVSIRVSEIFSNVSSF